MHIHVIYIYTQYAQTHRRKSFPLRSTVDARIHRHTHTGFRRRPATQELPLTQHGRRTDTHFIEHRIPATTGHARAAARSTHGHAATHTQRIPATTGHARASPYAARIHEEHAISQCHLLPQGNNQMSQHLYYSCFC